MKKIEYYCDVCGKKLDYLDYLTEIKIPMRRITYGFARKEKDQAVKPLEICLDCRCALYKIIQQHFADITFEECADGRNKTVVHSAKYKESQDEMEN